jgi:uncharacterized protein YqgC (DUF456 family)
MGASVWAFILALIMMLVGLAGVLMPFVPGVELMWLAVLGYAIVEGFAAIDPLAFAVLTILGLAGATSDLWLSLLGARISGASVSSTLFSILGAVIGGIIGFFVGGIGAFPGMVIGSALGVFLNEYRLRREWKGSGKAALGAVIGFTVSVVVQLVIGMAMLVIFVWQVLRG